MTLSTTTTLVRYTGNAATTVFPYTFRILAATDLVVTQRDASSLVETTLVYPTDYSVSGVGNTSGGSVTLNSAPATGDLIVIRRVLPITQGTSIRNQGSYFPETHETVFDRQTMVDQQHEEALGRTFALPSTLDPADYDMSLPIPEAGQVLAWTTSGLTNSSVASGDVVLPGEGRVTDTLSTYLANNYVYNVLDYDAKGDGVTDDTDAFDAAIVALVAAGGGVLRIPYTPAGYVVSRVLIQSSNVWVMADPSVSIKRTAAGGASQGMLEFLGAQTATTTTLSASAALAAVSLSVASESGFAAGDWIEIESSLQLGSAPYLYEYNRIDSTSAGALGLKWATRNAYSTTGPTVTVRKLSVLTNVGVSGGVWTGPGDTGDNIRFKWCAMPLVDRVQVTNHGQQGVVFQRVFGGSIRDSVSYGGVTTGSHGFALYSVEGALIEHCTVRDGAWDGFDLGNGSMYNTISRSRALNLTDVGFVIGHGQHGHHNTIDDCYTIHCGSGFQVGDTAYEGDDDNVIKDCRDLGSTNAFYLRQGSLRNRFVRCRSKSAGASGFNIPETTTLDNEFIDCESDGHLNFGILISGRSKVRGGKFINGTAVNANGIRVTGSAASDTLLDRVECSANGKHGIYVTGGALRVQIAFPKVAGALNSGSGILIDNGTDCRVIEPNAQSNAAWGVLISDVGGNCARSVVVGGVYASNASGTVNSNNNAEQTADKGDADATWTPDTDAPIVRYDTALTADRVVTLSHTNARPGMRVRVVRTGGGAFQLTVKDATGPTTLKAIPNSTAAFVDVEYNNSAFKLIGYGTL